MALAPVIRWRIRGIVNGCAAQQLVARPDVVAPTPRFAFARTPQAASPQDATWENVDLTNPP